MSRLLRLIVFDCDCTLWNFHVDSFFHQFPYKRVNGKVLDARDYEMITYPESLAVLEKWSKKCNIAVASRTTYPEGAESALKLFGFDKYIDYKEIYPGCKQKHFRSLAERTQISYNEMLFFDDEPRNIRDVSREGVECVLVDENVGVTLKMLDEAVEKFDRITRD